MPQIARGPLYIPAPEVGVVTRLHAPTPLRIFGYLLLRNPRNLEEVRVNVHYCYLDVSLRGAPPSFVEKYSRTTTPRRAISIIKGMTQRDGLDRTNEIQKMMFLQGLA